MKRTKADQAKLDKLGVEIALLSGELLRDELKSYPSEKPPSVKDMVASSIAWLDKVLEVPAKKEEPKKQETQQSQALSLEDVRKLMKDARGDQPARNVKAQPPVDSAATNPHQPE